MTSISQDIHPIVNLNKTKVKINQIHKLIESMILLNQYLKVQKSTLSSSRQLQIKQICTLNKIGLTKVLLTEASLETKVVVSAEDFIHQEEDLRCKNLATKIITRYEEKK